LFRTIPFVFRLKFNFDIYIYLFIRTWRWCMMHRNVVMISFLVLNFAIKSLLCIIIDKNFMECILLNYELSVMKKTEKVMKKVMENTAVASMRQTEALASVKFVQMLFLHWTHSIWIAPIIKRINCLTILVWLRHWKIIEFFVT